MVKVACSYRWTRHAICCFGLLIISSRSLAQSVDDFEARQYTDGTNTLPYRLFVPRDYDPARAYPLVLYLHSLGDGGTDNRKQLTGNSPELVFVRPDNQSVWPCFMMAPQCPADATWQAGESSEIPTIWMRLTIEVIDALQQEFSIDPGRLYVTGISMGGHGTWDAITRYPGKFAAAVPIAGTGTVRLADQCAQTPIWDFHSDDDPVVPVQFVRNMIAAVRAAGGEPIYTEYTGYGHQSGNPAYAEPDLLLWLFSQSH